ncbi:MAG: urease accessory protein UreD [Myxococcota bacterium]
MNDRASWPASLDLVFERRGERTALGRARHSGPLRVQRPFYPEDEAVCHVYLLHPPGGVAGGDTLSITIDVARAGHAVITTPAAGKFYRSAGALASQDVRCRVAAEACLEYLPQETIFFDGCRARQSIRAELAPGAGFIGWDISVLGRRASGEGFANGSALSRFELWRDGHPLWLEHSRYIGGSPALDAAWSMRGQSVHGTLLCVGAGDPSAALRQHIAGWSEREREHVAVTCIDGVTGVRFLADRAGRVAERFEELRALLRPVLAGRPAVTPRIWAT